jgi:chromate reductase
MDRYTVAVLVGSLREASLNRRVARAMCAAAPDRLDCRIVPFGDVSLYDQDLDKDPPEEWKRLREEIRGSDAVLFVSPEYNRSIPGGLKNAIDVASRPYGKSAFAGKPAGIATVSPGAIGGFGANHHLRQCCVFLDMPLLQQPESYFGNVGDDKFADDGSIADPGLKKVVEKFIAAFADWVALIHAGRQAQDASQSRH